jgi:hypothetical protein
MSRPGWAKPEQKYRYTSVASEEYLKSKGATERPNYPFPIKQGFILGLKLGRNAWNAAKRDPGSEGDCIKLKLTAVDFAHLYAQSDHDVQRMLNEVVAIQPDHVYGETWQAVRNGFMKSIDDGWRMFGCMEPRHGGGALPSHRIKLPPGFSGRSKRSKRSRRR